MASLSFLARTTMAELGVWERSGGVWGCLMSVWGVWNGSEGCLVGVWKGSERCLVGSGRGLEAVVKKLFSYSPHGIFLKNLLPKNHCKTHPTPLFKTVSHQKKDLSN